MAILDALGVKFVAATQPIDTTTPVGRLMPGVLAAVAEFEKAFVNEGLDRARAEGKRLGRPPGGRTKSPA